MTERGDERPELEAAEATRLGREFARLFDDVIEGALGELFAAVGRLGLSFAELRVLRALAELMPRSSAGQAPSRSVIAEATGLPAPTVGEAITALAVRGFVAQPARGAASLTGEGRALLRELRSKRLEALTDFVRDRDLGERLRLAGALHLLDVNFDARLHSDMSLASGAGPTEAA